MCELVFQFFFTKRRNSRGVEESGLAFHFCKHYTKTILNKCDYISAGDSAGGTMATVISHQLTQKHKTHRIKVSRYCNIHAYLLMAPCA